MDRKKLALIHIIKKELKLTDPEYRQILHEAVGVSSSKDLNDFQFKKLMNYFVRSKHWHVNPHGMTIKQKFYIQRLIDDTGWSQEHVLNFIHKYYHVDSLEKLTKAQASHLIESLKHIIQHQNH